jgi:hypothetical protein
MNYDKKLVLSFDVAPELMTGIRRLTAILPFVEGEGGIRVTAALGDRNSASLKDGQAFICYTKKNIFFRELAVLLEHAMTETEFSLEEDTHFTGLTTMVDTSRNAVPTVGAICRLMDHLAIMGYDTVLMYMEDTIKLENYRYFGYMRGRYDPADLKAMDDYAFEYGMEIMPCLECYGHMEKYLIWPEAAPMKDTASVLLAREEKTFALVEELIRIASSCLRTKRIHIGMDEAWSMGRGVFMDKHGYVPPFEIFNEYMDRLMQIVNKYGLTAMMWADMYFRNKSSRGGYYDTTVEFTQEDIDKIPEGIELIFWHYGEAPGCDDIMLQKCNQLGKKVIFAGGFWNWVGHFPEHNYTMESTRFSLDACRKNNVREAMATIWFNDNAECPLFANLFDLSFFAELCFDPDPSEDKLRSRFDFTTGGDYDAFYSMTLYHNTFGEGEVYPRYSDRFFGKPLFWQDIMEGLYDTHLFARADAGIPMSEHYADCAKKMAQYHGGTWDYLYDFAYKVFDYLAVKTKIGELLVPSYKAGDRETLAQIANTLLPLLKEKTQTVHAAHKAMWFASYRVLGWSNMDIRYGGMACRCDTAKALIDAYLAGETDCLEELEVERLHKSLGGFAHYSDMTTPNLKV